MVEAYRFAGTTMTVLVPGALTGNAFTVLHVIKPDGCSTPPHSHDEEAELPYVLSGVLGVETEGQETTVEAGACIVLPPTRPHRLFNRTGKTVREFLLCAPAHFDRFVATSGTPVAPYAEPAAMTDADRERLVATASHFGIRLLASASPPDTADPAALCAPKTLDLPGMAIEVLAKLGNTEADLVLLRGSLAPGRRLNLQSQSDPGCVFVIDGKLEVTPEDAPDQRKTFGSDEAIVAAPHTRQVARSIGAAPVNLLMVTTMRMARSFATIRSTAVGEPAAHGG